ncbi:unnamed protein product [Pylaiella littoralis]
MYRKLRSFSPEGDLFFGRNQTPGEIDVPGGLVVFFFPMLPRGVSTRGGCAKNGGPHTHTQQLPTVMDKVYEQAYQRQKGPEKNTGTECEEKEESNKKPSAWITVNYVRGVVSSVVYGNPRIMCKI